MQFWVECGRTMPDAVVKFRRKVYIEVTHGYEGVYEYANSVGNQGVFRTEMHYIDPLWVQNDKKKWVIDAENSLKASDFYLDFDAPSESEAGFAYVKADLAIAMRFLEQVMGIRENQTRLYFSGSKGIHLTVPMGALGIQPSTQLHRVYKMLVEKIKEHTTHGTLDSAIYDNKRMFRMANTRHDKTGVYKTRISYKELKKMTKEMVMAYASVPREDRGVSKSPSEKAFKYINWMVQKAEEDAAARKEFSGKMLELDEAPPCIVAMHQKLFRQTVDERNNSGTALASFYFQTGMEREDCMNIMMHWSENNCSPSMPESEIRTIVDSVYRTEARYGCGSFKRLSGVCDKERCPLFNKREKETTT
ncbi:primase C-terminal domain-containing protein [Rhodococcus sp. IEGM1300]